MGSQVVLEAPLSTLPGQKVPSSQLPGATKNGTQQPHSPFLRGESNTQEQLKPNSIPALPIAPKRQENSSVLKNGTFPTSESSPPPSKDLPRRIYRGQNQKPSGESDPFTKEPFIKEPFISPPSPDSGTVLGPQGYLPQTQSPSFKVALKEPTPKALIPVTKVSRDYKPIALPPLSAKIG
jgi:poly-gamma-glutamate synthesis protein (capsule biosynthesis protein)